MLRGCCPCFNLSVSVYQLDIKPESFYINEKVQGQWGIGIWSPYSNWIWKWLNYRSCVWWRHDTPYHWPFVRGRLSRPVDFLHKGSVIGTSDVFFIVTLNKPFNTLRPRQNGRHFADDIFKCMFFNENVWISIKISLKFVPKGPINNIPALAQIMAWRRPGDKPLSEAMMVNLPTHICVSRPQWVNKHSSCRWFGTAWHSCDVPVLDRINHCHWNEKWLID